MISLPTSTLDISHSIEIEQHFLKKRNATVLIIDDQSTGRLIFSEIIKSIDKDIQIMMFSDAHDAIEYARDHEIDMVLTDYSMPNLNGIETIRRLRTIYPYEELPIVVVTVFKDYDIRLQAFEAGATDFLTRPVDIHEGRLRCLNLLKMHQLQVANKSRIRVMEKLLSKLNLEIEEHDKDTWKRLISISKLRSSDNKLYRLSKYAEAIARCIGLAPAEAEIIERAVLLLDIGRVGISDHILYTDNSLAQRDSEMFANYIDIGNDILKYSPSNVLNLANTLLKGYRERYDGSGYPKGLSEEAISIESRIVGLADELDVLISSLPDPEEKKWERVLLYLVEQRGKKFDANLIDELLGNIHQLREVYFNL